MSEKRVSKGFNINSKLMKLKQFPYKHNHQQHAKPTFRLTINSYRNYANSFLKNKKTEICNNGAKRKM